MKSHLLFLAAAVSTAHSWNTIDTATLHFWSPPSDCTDEIFHEEQPHGIKTCSKSESVEDIDVVLDNTGAICYSNPMAYSASGASWFSWLGPSGYDLMAYSLWVPEGQPVPECDQRGVCDPCDALDPIRGSNATDWGNWNATLIVELGYDFSGSVAEEGCGSWQFLPANDVHPTNFCFAFQGNITVEAGDPFSCANKGITSAEKCGAACDEEEGLERSVFANQENGEPACCECYYYNRGGIIEVCGQDNSFGLCYAPSYLTSGGEDAIRPGAFAMSVGVAALSTCRCYFGESINWHSHPFLIMHNIYTLLS